LLEILDAPELAQDPRFKENTGRMAHLKELSELLGKIIVKHSTAEWLARLEKAGVPAGPVLNINEMHRDPHTLARDMVVTVEHARLGAVKTIGLPVKFSETPGKVAHGAPLYGQHTHEVLSEHGYGDDEIAALIEKDAVVAAG
jgi:crotonobetainyl-CoA:carnitine CoA-transferase CaiB-like acyl-CoA transferase